MSNQVIVDYLTKKLYIEKAIVTYRLLSREFGIHVNVAKNELAKFHAEGPFLSHPVESFATYLISGEPLSSSSKDRPSSEDEDDNPYLDEEEDRTEKEGGDFEFGDSEEVRQLHMSLVGEANLEATKARFKNVDSIHVHCLTPSPLRDPRLICTVASQIREVDNKKGDEMAKAVGKITGPPRQYINEPVKTVSISSKPMYNSTDKKEEVKPKAPRVIKQEEKPKEEAKPANKTTEKPKPPGRQDFFKPKPKETRKEEKAKADTGDQPAAKMFFNVTKKEKEQKEAVGPSRGTKRKSIAPSVKSESEDNAPSTSTAQPKPVSKSKEPTKMAPDNLASNFATKVAVRVKNGTVFSDEEDVPRVSRRKSKTIERMDVENAARALMDIDDKQITRASSFGAPVEKETDEEEEMVSPEARGGDEDIEMEDEEEPKPKPKRKARKPRKVVPVGRNGLKKKRIVKSRTNVDEKGYMVTEDYSSYESVEEEEAEQPKAKGKGKGKGKAKAAVETDKEADDNDAAPPVAPEAKGVTRAGSTKLTKPKVTRKSSKGGQASLVSFFGPPKAKK